MLFFLDYVLPTKFLIVFFSNVFFVVVCLTVTCHTQEGQAKEWIYRGSFRLEHVNKVKERLELNNDAPKKTSTSDGDILDS